jgi:hypothetical protein
MEDTDELNLVLSTTILSTPVVKSLGILVEEFTACVILYLTSSLPGFVISLRKSICMSPQIINTEFGLCRYAGYHTVSL